jgi:peptidoglycan pentaglycine glycine transferase (the first glycine)
MPGLEVRLLENLCPASPLGAQWESLTRANSASGFMQSLHWAEVKRKQGLSSFHLGAFLNEELIGGAIFYSSMKRNGAGLLIAPEGPVLPWDNHSLTTRALGQIIDTLQSRALELGVMAMRIEPRLPPPVIPVLREFGKAPIDLVPRETLFIDLSPSEENILAAMKPKGRYNIKLAERSGVEINFDCTLDSVRRFYSVMRDASNRDQFDIESRQFFEHIVDVLVPAGCAKFVFAEHDSDVLGALLLITYGDRATYLYGGVTNNKRNFMGGYALQWAAMKAAKQAGCTTYDFYGFNPFRAPGHEYSRFSQFKSQFGGTAVRTIGAQDYFFMDNVTDAFIKVVNETENSYSLIKCC